MLQLLKINIDQYWIQIKKKDKILQKANYYTSQLIQLFLRQLIDAFNWTFAIFHVISDVQVHNDRCSIEERKEEGKEVSRPRIISLTCAPTNLYESRVSRFTRCVTSSIVF